MTYFFLSCLLLLVLSVAHAAPSSQRQALGSSTLQPIAFLVRGGDDDPKQVAEPSSSSLGTYAVLEESVLFSRWRILYQRLVRMPNGNVVDFDVVGQKGADGAAIIFAWNSQTKTATLCREYNPGPNKILCGLAAGLIEGDKHSDPKMAAECELEEEIHLAGGTWHELTESPLAMDKYATTLIHAFLVIDAQPVANPRPLDDEEDIEILTNVSVDEIKRMIRQGGMNVVGSWAALLGLEKLRELGEI
eukprot:CAMPEP_0119015666 /NCGR_PEP_ID=MMETSP1176-20130426/11388_1 /TAXON_ID=265551 /ORGANISM="Synedropsis recta cf, Strain CCMP1620" /LENGTH=246 /DNA_ID=CAMNT_0006968977 /DNA_START=17 /DNA_END=757 /DNA_ORIENTATION=+